MIRDLMQQFPDLLLLAIKAERARKVGLACSFNLLQGVGVSGIRWGA